MIIKGACVTFGKIYLCVKREKTRKILYDSYMQWLTPPYSFQSLSLSSPDEQFLPLSYLLCIWHILLKPFFMIIKGALCHFLQIYLCVKSYSFIFSLIPCCFFSFIITESTNHLISALFFTTHFALQFLLSLIFLCYLCSSTYSSIVLHILKWRYLKKEKQWILF